MEDLYRSDNWRSLDKSGRAELLLVTEGLRKGAIVRGNWTTFLDVLDQTGLRYKLNTDKYQLDPVIVVARQEDLREQNNRLLTLSENSGAKEFHEINGWLLGYPKCCTAEYARERTPLEDFEHMKGNIHRGYKFGRELEETIKETGSYLDAFDYRPASFTPCSINCSEAIDVLTSWKDAIEANDPKAAKALVRFNRQSYPQGLAHLDYWKKENGKRDLEYRLKVLRESVS